MKKLHQLAKELHANNYVMTDKMKEQFEDFLSIIAEGARILHPTFGLGTVINTQGNVWIVVEFDKEVEDYKKALLNYQLNKAKEPNIYWYLPSKPKKAVMISSCTSIHMLIKREQERKLESIIEPLKPFDF